DALEVTLLAHVRLAHHRTPGGRVRRPGRGGATRARNRSGLCRRGKARPAPEIPGVGGGEGRRRIAADRVANLPDVRRPPRRVVDVPVPDPRAPARGRL